MKLTDPLVEVFGLTPPVSGSLEVRIAPERSGFLTVTSSVAAPVQTGGSVGFNLPAAFRGEGARAGQPHVIPGITASPGFRTNLILAETTGVDAATVQVSLYDGQGTKMGDLVAAVPRYGQRQLSGVVEWLHGTSDVASGSIELLVSSGGGSVVGLATVIDNADDDAVVYFGRPIDSPVGPAGASVAQGASSATATSTVKSVVPSLVNGFKTFLE